MGIAGVPVFFGREAIQSLQYAPVIHQINKRCRWLLDYTSKELQPAQACHPHLFEGQNIDVNALGTPACCGSDNLFHL